MASHPKLRDQMRLHVEAAAELLFCENETNTQAALRRRRSRVLSRTASTTTSSTANPHAVNPDRRRHKVRRAFAI